MGREARKRGNWGVEGYRTCRQKKRGRKEGGVSPTGSAVPGLYVRTTQVTGLSRVPCGC